MSSPIQIINGIINSNHLLIVNYHKDRLVNCKNGISAQIRNRNVTVLLTLLIINSTKLLRLLLLLYAHTLPNRARSVSMSLSLYDSP